MSSALRSRRFCSHPVVLTEQVGVDQRQAGCPCVHQRRMRFVFFVRAERRQADRTGFDFLAGRMACRALQVGVLLVGGGRVVDHQRTGLMRHHRDVVEDLQQVLPPRDGVVALDEFGRRHRLLPVLEDRAPQLPDRGVDELALLFGVDQLGAVRHPGHEARGVQVDHVDAFMVAVVVPLATTDRQPLQVQRGVRRRLAGVGARQVHRTDVGRDVRLRRQAVQPRLWHSVVDHGNREATRDAVDLLIELRQVDAFEFDRGELRIGIGRRDNLQFSLVQRVVAVEREALAARSHCDSPGGVQALREAQPEGVLRLDGVFVPAALVECQQPLEVGDAATVIVDDQTLGRGIVFDDHVRRAGAACVLQQLRDQRELVRECEAPVAKGAALVDSDLQFHEVLRLEAGGHPEVTSRSCGVEGDSGCRVHLCALPASAAGGTWAGSLMRQIGATT